MDQLYDTAQQYLGKHNVLSLATVDGNMPWVAPVFYAVWTNKLIFLSASHTLHCKNIERNPQVAASVQEDYSDWLQIKGFQIRGVVHRLDDACVPSAIDTYSEKFPITGEVAPAEIASALDRISWFGISLQQVWFIDNSRGLGHRDELDPVRLFTK